MNRTKKHYEKTGIVTTAQINVGTIEFMAVVFYIWQAIKYYSDLFSIVVEDIPLETQVQILRTIDNIPYIQFTFTKANNACVYSMSEIRDMVNEYLTYELLPQQDILHLYRGGNKIYDIVEALYIALVFERKKTICFNVLIVDNQSVFNYMRQLQNTAYGES